MSTSTRAQAYHPQRPRRPRVLPARIPRFGIAIAILMAILLAAPVGPWVGSHGGRASSTSGSSMPSPSVGSEPGRSAAGGSLPPRTWTNITSSMGEPGAGPTFTPWVAYYPPLQELIMLSFVYSDPTHLKSVWDQHWAGPVSLWSFKDSQWTNITAKVKGDWPFPGYGTAALAYDPPTESLILVSYTRNGSGYTYGVPTNLSAWSFRNFTWTYLGSAPVLPSDSYDALGPKYGANIGFNATFFMYGLRLLGLTYDPGVHGLIMLGGPTTLSVVDGENGSWADYLGNDTTWGIINGSWVNLTDRLGTEPTGLSYQDSQLAYDPGSGCVVSISSNSYEDFNLSGYHYLTPLTTWELCHGNWSQVVTNATLPIGANVAAGPFIYDPQLKGDLDWGSWNNSWLFTNGTWTRVNWTGPVPPKSMDSDTFSVANNTGMSDTALVYDPAERYLFLLGGSAVSPYLVFQSRDGSLPWTAHMAYGFGRLPPFLALTANPNPGEVGAPTTLTASLTGGVLPVSFSYSGLPPGCGSANRSIIECLPTVTGNYTVVGTVTDALGRAAVGSILLRVEPTAEVALTVSRDVMDLGQTAQFRLMIEGGFPPYQFGYDGLPFGCTSVDAAELNCTPEEVGNYSVIGAVTDSEGAVVSSIVNLTVHPDPRVTVRSSRASLDVGQVVNLGADVSGGTGPFGWSYAGLPLGCPSENAPNVSCGPSRPGSYTVEVIATDAVGVVARANVTLAVWPRLTVTVGSGAPKESVVGGSVEWRIQIGGGLGPYGIELEGWAGATLSGQNVSWTPTTVGNYTLTVLVTDSNRGIAEGEANLTVGPAPARASSVGEAWVVVGVGTGGVIIGVAFAIWRRRRP